jgi:uncharacterized membrane protein YeaQ/YmgE (transglycosylase-associated protein family)
MDQGRDDQPSTAGTADGRDPSEPLSSRVRVGVIGALIGAFVLGTFITDHVLAPLGTVAGSLVAQIIVAFIGAALVLAVLHVFTRRDSGSRARSWRRE